jgi:signal transduction histidine kinase
MSKSRPSSKSPVRGETVKGQAATGLPGRSVTVASLTPISEALGGDKSPQEVLQLILKSAHGITRASSASLMLLDRESGLLRVMAAEGFRDKSIFKTHLKVGQGVTGWVAETGVPLRLGNAARDRRYVRVQQSLRSELAVPLKSHGRVIGVISVDSTKLNHFSSEDEALLISLAAQSARVIETTRLLEESRRRAEEKGLLLEASRMLAGTLDFTQVLNRLTQMTAEFWRAPVAVVYLVSEDGKELSLAACHGGSESFKSMTTLPVEGTFMGRVLNAKTDAPVFRNLLDEVRPEARAIMEANGLKTAIAVPLAAQGRALGVLCVFAGAERSFENDDVHLLAGLARSAALAIENTHIHRKILALEETVHGAEKSALLVELAAGLAHEIRNPLTSIRLLFDSLVRSPVAASVPGSDPASDAQMIQKQLERLERLVESYLENARARASAMQTTRLDLNTVIEESLLLLTGSAPEGLRISCTLHDDELPVRGDSTQLSQVVYNLVLNAMQALGGETAGAGRRGRVEIRSGSKDGRAWFEVSDDGPGLPDEVRARMFQPFLTTRKQGVGLGLSIVKRIVEAHGGALSVESPRAELGRGVRFLIDLPLAGR